MKNIFKRIDNFYNNNKWFRVAYTIFEYVIMFVIAFLSLIGLICLAKKPVIYSNEYDLSNDNFEIDYSLGSVTYVSYDTDFIDNEYFISINGEHAIIDWLDYKTVWVGSNKMVLSLPNNDYITIKNVKYYDVKLIEVQGNSIYFIGNGVEIIKFNKSELLSTDYLSFHYQTSDDAYNIGYEHGFDEVFNSNNLIPVAEKKVKGALGPSPEYFGFRIPVNTKVKSIMLINSVGWSLKPLEWTGGNSLYQGFQIKYEQGLTDYIRFNDTYDSFKDIMEFELDRDLKVEYIDIIFALNDPTIIQARFDDLQDSMIKNLGFYINNKVLNDEAIARFKEIIEYELRNTLKDEYRDIYYQQGYDKGLTANPNNHWSDLLFTIFGAFGTILGIEILPGWSIGIIIGIPIVFGIIYFIIGRKKD